MLEDQLQASYLLRSHGQPTLLHNNKFTSRDMNNEYDNAYMNNN